MNRENLIKKLVDRKLASTEKNKVFCVCLARVLCMANNQGPVLKK